MKLHSFMITLQEFWDEAKTDEERDGIIEMFKEKFKVAVIATLLKLPPEEVIKSAKSFFAEYGKG